MAEDGGCTNPCADQYLVNYRLMQLEAIKQHLFCGGNTSWSICIENHGKRILYKCRQSLSADSQSTMNILEDKKVANTWPIEHLMLHIDLRLDITLYQRQAALIC